MHQRFPERGKQGFSLAEILLALAIGAILISLVSLNFRSQRGRSSSKALASILAQEFRGAQIKAQRDQRPVAVVFPSQGKTKPISQGFLLLDGYEAPKLRREVDLSSENKSAQLMIGVWPVSSPDGNEINAVPQAEDAIDLDAWLPASLQGDYCLVFLPSGRVQTNDLPMFDDAFHVLVGAGIDYTASGAPTGSPSVSVSAPNYFAPTKVGEPYTVIVEATGDIRLATGVAGSTGGLVTQAFSPTQSPASLAAIPAVANRVPVMTGIDVSPELDPTLAPPGIDAQLQPGEHLTLEVTATDQDGDELFCEWTSDGDYGNFSSPSETRMVWDEATRTRKSVWTWQPPSTALVGDPFELTCTVRDSNGAVASPIVGSVINGQTEAEGTIFYLRRQGAFQYAYTCKPDGTGERRITDQNILYWREVHTALDSSRIVYSARRNGTGDVQVERANIDGTNVEVLHHIPGLDFAWPRINPQGTHIIYNRNGELWKMDADGTNHVQMTSGPGPNSYVSWSPNGDRIAWIRDQAGLKVMDVDPVNGFLPAGPENEILTLTCHYVEWQPTTNPRLLVSRKNGSDPIFHVDPNNPGDRVNLPLIPGSPPGSSTLACWSPDGTQILYGDRDIGLWTINLDGTNARKIMNGPVDFPIWVQ